MVRIMKKDGNRLEGIGERIAVRLTLLEEALGMTPGDPEIYGNWIASKAPEPENGAEEVGVIEGMDAVEDATTCFPRTEDGVPFCWDYQIKGFFKDACSALRRVPGTRSSKLTAFKKVIDGTVFVEQRRIPFQLPEGAECGRCERPLRASSASGERVALAASETVPAGTVLEFSILVMNPKDGRPCASGWTTVPCAACSNGATAARAASSGKKSKARTDHVTHNTQIRHHG